MLFSLNYVTRTVTRTAHQSLPRIIESILNVDACVYNGLLYAARYLEYKSNKNCH